MGNRPSSKSPLSAFSYTICHSFCQTTSQSLSKSKEDFIKLCSAGRLREAFLNFKSEIWSEPSLFTHLLQACIPRQSLSQAQLLHGLVLTSGCSSDKFISNHLLNVYVKCGCLSVASVLFGVMPMKNVMSSNILIGGYIQNGELEIAQKIFDEMPERNIATWNAMVTGLVQFGLNEEGLGLFSQMQGSALRPDEFTLGSVLRCSAGSRLLEFGCQIHAYIVKSGFHSYLVVGSSLAHMYLKCRCIEEGERVFEGMPVHNVVACNTIIAGRAQNGDPEGAMDQFNLMKKGGFRPDQITLVSVISSCSELATIGQGQQVHAHAIKIGTDSEASVRSSLVNMYSKCGCLNDSEKAFLELESSDIVLWSAMICAYGFHGRGQEAVKLFERMERQGIDPNDVTFLGLLYACCHGGLKEQGEELFKLMMEKYELQPKLEHYTCMVDLLGRAGCLGEAEALIRLMPVKPDTVIWKTLLSACNIHRNAGMARRIAEDVLRLDPQDSASYVLLSNIHAAEAKWRDVSELREAMRERKVKKEPGISWVEVKNQIHQFSMGDRSHLKWREIHAYLNKLMTEIKGHGYVPDTASVLHDMEVEEKEHSLAHHSEKLAIAFALLSTPGEAPIRIMKNLRVCNDCHLSIKLISKITTREIIVRDVSRFHHFKDGECSCADYW